MTIDDIYIGNGASELIVMSMQALLDNGDEVLVPTPDYPLWTAAVTLAGGKAVHYLCNEEKDWMPDLADIEAKITPHTKAIVVINPNNPTGALYPDELLKKIVDLAREHQLIVFADEIYDKCLYDGTTHTSIASLANDVLFITMNGLSKNYRSCRLPGRLDGRFRGKEICPGLYCRAGYAFIHASVLERTGPVRHSDSAGGVSEHQRSGCTGRQG